MGESYLVEGAELRCMNGTAGSNLHITIGCNNYHENERQKASNVDCKPRENIHSFGTCRLQGGKPCENYMKLKKKWETPRIVTSAEQINGRIALTMESFLICERGGFIVPRTSGQGQTQSINWEDYWKRYSSMLGVTARTKSGFIWKFDPINMNTGNFIYEKEDLVIRGITKLSFHMTYCSMAENQNGCLGEGWHHNYEIFIEEKETGILYLHLGNGQIVPGIKNVGNLYVLSGVSGLLKKEDGGYRYVNGAGLEYYFDKDGRITQRKDRFGNADSFLYDKSGQLIEVRGANGGILHYEYNNEGNLYRVSDHTGREVRIGYCYRVLCQFINSSGQEYTYHYNENLRLKSVITPRGIVGVKNVYDNANRVVEQTTPDGGRVELRYDDKGMCTYAKDQNGYITAYESDDKFRNIRTIYKNGEEQYKYDQNNQITRYIDRNGNMTQYSYDDRGKLIRIINALGEERNFAYDEKGNVLSIDIDGERIINNTYNSKGQLIKSTDALGRSRETVYTENGLPEKMIMPDGSAVQMAYDERGNVQRITNVYGLVTEYSYDALNRLIQIIDGEGNQVSYQYDERDHLVSETNLDGCVRKYTYDVSGRPIQIEDFDGGIIVFSYNSMGKLEEMTDKEGRKTKRKYNLSGKIEEEISPLGRKAVYQYDRDERLIQIKYLASEQEEESKRVIDFVYDSVGNLLYVKEGDGREIISETMYEYDALNRVTATIDPVGERTTYTYDKKSGKVSSVTDATGNRRAFQYNAAGELIEETDAGGNTTRYQYNELGKITAVTDAVGRETKNYYLSGGRLEKSIYSDGREMLYEYDALGRIRQKTDDKGYSLSYAYDSMGRILHVASNTGQKISYTYDTTGNVTTVTDAGGNITKYAYTLSGKIKEVTDALGNATEYSYDLEDNLIYICQHGTPGEEDRITEYERDAFGKVTCVRSALGEEHYHYDTLGRMIEKTDREGGVTAYTYTADGMAESILYSDGRKAEFTYSPLKQLILIRDWLGETKIDRDKQGRPVDITDYKGRNIHYEWGNLGERRKLIYPDGTTLKWQYDEMLRPVELAKTAGGDEMFRINYRYDEQGRLLERWNSGGYHTCWHYNELGQLDELIHKEQSGILDRICYAYDALGNKDVIRKERRGFPSESGEYRYIYDALHRLIGVEKDGRKLRCYQYDSFGNRTCMEDYAEDMRYVYTYDNMNQMIEKMSSPISESEETESHTTYVYDGRGNLTGEYCNGRLRHGYTYNMANRLERSWDDKGREADYIYNALGQRTGKCCGEKTEEYLLDLTKPYNNLIGVKEQDGTKKFFWDANVAVMEDKWQKLHYYMQDELGSPLRVLYGNGNGDIYGYDEFGREISCQGNYGSQGEKQPFGYTGYRYDAISQTYFAQAREYQPEYGRFMAEDIKSGNRTVPKTRNRYGYCWNNPLGMVDLDGQEPEVPTLDFQFPQFVPKEENVVPQYPYFEEPFKTSENDVEGDIIQSILLFEPLEGYQSGSNSTTVLEKEHEVYIINLTGTIGIIGYGSVGVQIVFDEEGNWDVQFPLGGGAMLATHGSVTVAWGRLRVPNVEDAAGHGTEVGIGGGEALVFGVNLISAYDARGNKIGDGEMFYFGMGEQLPVVEAHLERNYTISTKVTAQKIADYLSKLGNKD